MPKNIFIFGSSANSLKNFRGTLIKTLIAEGHTVHCAAPFSKQESRVLEWLVRQQVSVHNVKFPRTGLNPVLDLVLIFRIFVLLRKISPDIFFAYTAKPVIWGIFAAWLARVPRRVALITGLGYAFTGHAIGLRAFLKNLLRFLYRMALRAAHVVVFQNTDDSAYFWRLKLVSRFNKVVVVNGSGVDTQHFSVTPIPRKPISFLLIARLIRDKGIREYIAAAERIKSKYPTVKFYLVGGLDENPDGMNKAEINSLLAGGTVMWLGELEDVRDAIKAAHVFVLPSYREGTPRTVLEAMSMGRPIITTDVPGCRQTTIEGINGFLVRAQDPASLCDAMKRFIDKPELIPKMGLESRRLAEEKYEVTKVNSMIIENLFHCDTHF